MLVRIYEYISWKKARGDKKLELHPGEYRRVYQGNMEGRVEEILTEKMTEKKTGYQLADYDIVTLSTREEFLRFIFIKMKVFIHFPSILIRQILPWNNFTV